MEAIMMLVAVPLLLLNLLGGLIGGIGLLLQGEWRLVLGGFAYGLIGPYLLSIAMLPAMAFLPLSVWAANRNSTVLAIAAAVPNMVWTYAVVAVSCIFVFSFITTGADGGIFHILWGYSTATAPWSFMAQKDKQGGNDSSTILMFFIQMGIASMMAAVMIDSSDTTPARLALWFLPFMGLGFATQLFIAMVEVRNARYGRF